MAGKRSATDELNHDNWNQEDEPEERGTFQMASENTLKSRVIRTAKRRNPIRAEEGDKKSAFVGFTAFASKPPSSDFSFLKDISKTDSTPKTNGIDKHETSKSSTINIFSNTATANAASIFGAPSTISTNIFNTTNSSAIVPSTSTNSKKSEKYCSRLKGLNESVSKWISKKVEDNPLISLQPIFKDYEKYLEEIEKDESAVVATAKPVPTFNYTPLTDKNTKAMPEKISDKKDVSVPNFKFGPPATVTSKAPTFSFGSSNNSPGGIKPFSSLGSSSTATVSFGSSSGSSSTLFPVSTGYSFGATEKSNTDKPKEGTEENNEQDEDEPPKVEFKAVVEKDHIYTIRCKVFVKKNDSFGDRGVGNLYLKPVENSENKQLIVRADTNLGNLLLNFILSKNVPTKRMGKKDVMLVAIPTPDSQPPPTPILLRVKSPEDADDLLKVLEKHKE